MSSNLSAELRTTSGKGTARKLRAAGRLPAVIYGEGKDAVSITIDPGALDKLFRTTQNRNTVVNVQLDGGDNACIVRAAQRHPLTREILHVDFFKPAEGQAVKVMVPLTTSGKSVGAELGGRIRLIRRELPVRCVITNIPTSIVFDVTPLKIGDMVQSSNLVLPEGVELALDNDIFVVTCYGKRAAKEGDDEEAAAAAPAAS